MGKGVVKLGEGNWAVKDGNLLAAKETNGRFKNAEFTVTRGTDATYVGKDGLIKKASFYNLIDYSEDFDETTSDWTNTNVSVETNSTISPQGINNAAKITEDTSNSEHQIQFVFSQTINTNYSYSVFVKANGRNYCGMNIGASRLYANFDLTDGSVTNVQSNGTDFNNESASITSFGNGWYKCTLSGYALTINGSYVRFTLRNVESSDSFLNYLGDGTSGVYIWGAQLEALSYATSYIPTLTGSTVTRATETLNGSGNSTLINTTQGTLFLESKLGGTTGTKLFSLGAGTNNADPAVLVGYTGSNMYFDFIDGVGNPGVTSLVDSPDIRIISGINTDSYNKMAVSYTSTSVTVFLNGVKKVTKSGVDFTPTNNLKALYAGYGVGSKFEGEVKAVAVFNEALSDDELELLTGVTNYSSFGALAAAGGYTII